MRSGQNSQEIIKEILHVYLPSKLAVAVKSAADKSGRSVAAWATSAADDFLDNPTSVIFKKFNQVAKNQIVVKVSQAKARAIRSAAYKSDLSLSIWMANAMVKQLEDQADVLADPPSTSGAKERLQIVLPRELASKVKYKAKGYRLSTSAWIANVLEAQLAAEEQAYNKSNNREALLFLKRGDTVIERGLGRRYRFEQYTADPEGGIPFVKLKADSDDYPSRTMRITTLFNGFIFVKQYSQEICKDV